MTACGLVGITKWSAEGNEDGGWCEAAVVLAVGFVLEARTRHLTQLRSPHATQQMACGA